LFAGGSEADKIKGLFGVILFLIAARVLEFI